MSRISHNFNIAVDPNPMATARRQATGFVLPWLNTFLQDTPLDWGTWNHQISAQIKLSERDDAPFTERCNAVADALFRFESAQAKIRHVDYILTSSNLILFEVELGIVKAPYSEYPSVTVRINNGLHAADLFALADTGDYSAQFVVRHLQLGLIEAFGADDGGNKFNEIKSTYTMEESK